MTILGLGDTRDRLICLAWGMGLCLLVYVWGHYVYNYHSIYIY